MLALAARVRHVLAVAFLRSHTTIDAHAAHLLPLLVLPLLACCCLHLSCSHALLPLPAPCGLQDKFIPELARAFFSMDESRLSVMCRDAAMAQIRAVAAAREVEGLTMGSAVLAVQKTDFVQARKLEAGVPIILVTSLVQYIHCVRNRTVRAASARLRRCLAAVVLAPRVQQAAHAALSAGHLWAPVTFLACRSSQCSILQGEIVEGSESDIRATHFILAVTRDVDPATGALAWRVVEMSLQGTMAYL